jgi:ABC-type transporter Mla maintaining outer membrane lipid asymmetry ATPase subunit MlaF
VNVDMRDTHRSFGKNRAAAGVDLRLGTLVLLDEPTAGLDPEQRVQFRGLLYSAVLAEARS